MNTMLKIATKLWPVCPELKPDGLGYDETYGWYDADLANAEGKIDGGISEAWAEALMRDRMVWWLAEQGDHVELHAYPNERDEDEFAAVEFQSNTSGAWWNASDPTEALYLACCRVLGVQP